MDKQGQERNFARSKAASGTIEDGACYRMSLKAKLEAVIYAAEEPVTLAQLAVLFLDEALQWKAEHEAATEAQGEEPLAAEAVALPLLNEAFPSLELELDAAETGEKEADESAGVDIRVTAGVETGVTNLRFYSYRMRTYTLASSAWTRT